MPLAPVDQLFAAFQQHGDASTLAQVFDATASELLRVARYLARDAHAAEDLLQTTFLKAIEHRASYDAARPVLPWLLKILANQARYERRQQRRTDPTVVALASASPDAIAEQAELQRHLHESLRGLPEPYREVLLLQLEHGLTTTEISECLARKPGTVRTQLARGMEMLRRSLPVGIATSTALMLSSSRGMAAVRTAVVRAAASEGTVAIATGAIAAGSTAFGATAAAAAASTATALGGILMKKVMIAVVLLVGALGLVSQLWQQDAAAPHALPPDRSTVAQAATDPGAIPLDINNKPQRIQVAEPTTQPATLVLRVRYADGSDAMDVGVLVAGDAIGAIGREARTDATGSAQFDALPIGTILVKPDRCAPQTITLASGTNSLDIELPEGIDVDGQVTNQLREAVPGARIFANSLEHHDHAQYLATADENGLFALKALAPGTTLFARASGYQPGDPKYSALDGLQGSTKQIVLRVGAAGFRLAGQVRDADGKPAAFALVAIAVDQDCKKWPDGLHTHRSRNDGSRPLDREGFLVRADRNGWFTTNEVPEGDALVFARSAGTNEPGIATRRVMVTEAGQEPCDLVLRDGAELFGTVSDETGKPVANLPILASWRGTLELGSLEGGLGALLSSVQTRTAADGSYRLRGLLAGEHRLYLGGSLNRQLRIEDPLDQKSNRTLIGAEQQRADLRVTRRGDLSILLVDPKGKPLAGWGVWVGNSTDIRMQQLENQRTDKFGRLRVPNLERDRTYGLSVHRPRKAEAGDRLVDRLPARTWPEARVSDDELKLQLTDDEFAVGSLAGRFIDATGTPKAFEFSKLEPSGWHEVRKLATASDGSFLYDDLPAGEYLLRPGAAGDPTFGPFLVTPGAHLDIGEVTLPELGRFQVRLVSSDGSRIDHPRATMLARDRDRQHFGLRDQDGLLTSYPIIPGRYQLFVRGDEHAGSMHEVTVLRGTDVTQELLCERGYRQLFVVTLPPGAAPPVPNRVGNIVEYDVYWDADAPLHMRVGQSTSLGFAVPMTAGTWRIRIEVPGYERVYHTVRTGNAPTKEPILLPIK